MLMKKVILFFLYSIALLLIGRNLLFLPRINYTSSQDNTNKVKEKIQKLISSQTGNYSVYYEDFTTNADIAINDKQIHIAASVNKIPIIAGLYYLAGQKRINLEDQITLQKEDIQAYGTGSLQYEEPGSVYSYKTLAKLSLQKSDNTAAHIIANKIGVDKIQKAVNAWGLTQTDMENNKTSLSDMALLFKKIYKGEITTPALTKELLSFTRDTDIEDRLPALLPKDITVYHKTGDAVGGVHDVGIVENEGKAYFVGILTSDIGNTQEKTIKTIRLISQMIYNLHTEQ